MSDFTVCNEANCKLKQECEECGVRKIAIETDAELRTLKQERDEFAAQVEVLQDVCGFVITGPDALREIQARTLEEAAKWAENCGEWLADSTFTGLSNQYRAMAAAKRKGE